MPRFDGTGPQGMGPMTGGGRGVCVLPAGGNEVRYTGGGFLRPLGGFSRGRGAWGRGRAAMGGGYGWGYRAMPYAPSYGPEVSSRRDLEWLEEQAKGMEGELERIRGQIEELRGSA